MAVVSLMSPKGVGCAVAVEESDVGLYLLDGEGLAGAVALVDAVKAGTHAGAVGFRSAAGKCQQDGYDGQQVFHRCKGNTFPRKHKTDAPGFFRGRSTQTRMTA